MTAQLSVSGVLVPAAIVVVAFFANAELFRLFARRKGAAFAVGALLFHQVYYLYSSAAYVLCWFFAKLDALSQFRRAKE